MANIKDAAKAYTPPQTKNIADLEKVNLDLFIEQRTGKNEEGKDFSYNVVLCDGIEYRIPNTVLRDIKIILESKPSVKFVRVVKKGTGMNTTYTTIPLD